MDMKINQVVVMYLDIHRAGDILHPESPPDVSPCKGIMSSYSFLFLGTRHHYLMRAYSCWCPACSRVRGRGHGAVSRNKYLDVPGCTRKQLTRWEEGRFTVSKAAGIQERKKLEQDTIDKAMSKAKPGAWGCVQVCDPTNLGLLWRVRVMVFLMCIIHVICV